MAPKALAKPKPGKGKELVTNKGKNGPGKKVAAPMKATRAAGKPKGNRGKGKKGKKRRMKKKKKRRCPIKRRKKPIKRKCTNPLVKSAMLNLYFVAHGVPEALRLRKFKWKKKKK